MSENISSFQRADENAMRRVIAKMKYSKLENSMQNNLYNDNSYDYLEEKSKEDSSIGKILIYASAAAIIFGLCIMLWNSSHKKSRASVASMPSRSSTVSTSTAGTKQKTAGNNTNSNTQTQTQTKQQNTKTVKIPSDAKNFRGHAYKVFHETLNWNDAESACAKMGGHLFTANNDAEYKFVLSLLPSEKKLYWLGATDTEHEGTWKWVTDEPFRYTQWLKDEPNGGTQENYLMLTNYYQNKWGWNDSPEAPAYACGYICEWEEENKNFAEKVYMSVKGTNVNLRERPDIDSRVIVRLNEGITIEVLNRTKRYDGEWLNVRTPEGRIGWIYGDYVRGRLGTRGDHGGVFGVVNATNVNIRKEPRTSSSSVARLASGRVVEIVDKASMRDGIWFKIYTLDGYSGWMFSRYIRERKDN